MSVTLILIYFLITAITVVYFLLKKRLLHWKDRGILYDEPSLIMGSLSGVGTTIHFSDAYKKVYNKFKGTGPVVGFFNLMSPAIMLLDLDVIKSVLIKDFNSFANRGLYSNELDDPLSAHLVNLDGPKWKSLRHKLTPTFTSGKMKFMFPTVVSVGKRFTEVFESLVETESTVEIKDLLGRFTTDVIGTCAFGIECNSLSDPKAKFLEMGKKPFIEPRHNFAVLGFMMAFPRIAKFFHMKDNSDDVIEFFMRIVQENVEYREKNKIERNDFMNMLIELKNTKSFKNESGEEITGITMNELAAQSFVFFLAGFETSSTTMGFCLHELAVNQDIQNKLRNEIAEVIGNHKGELTYESIKEMKYLDKVIQETLRKHSVVAHLIRQSTADYDIPGTNFTLEKGTMVVVPVDAIHHDPEIFPNPDKFDPERFSTEEIQNRHSEAYLPFGDGPRNCIGLRFGKMQARVGLVSLLQKFKFSVCDKTDIPIKKSPVGLLTSSEGGIYLKVERV